MLAVSEEYLEWEDDEESREIHLTVPQTEFTLSNDKYPLFLAGFGSGKSLCMVVNILRDLEYPGANIGAYAPTYDLLSLITAPYLEEQLSIAKIPYKFNKNQNMIHVEGYGNIIMRSLDNPARIVGYQVFRSHIDEIDTLPTKKARDAWNKVIARNRQKVYVRDNNGRRIPIGKGPDGRVIYKTHLNRVSGYTTPEGFSFCYQQWEKEPKDGYKIYRASTYSNAHNLPEDYIDSLKSTYPPELVDAYINGYFVNLVGERVYRNFDRELNLSRETVQPGDSLYIGMDFNVIHGAAIIHVLRDGGRTVHAVDEIHDAYDTDEQIAYLKENYSDHEINIYPDATGRHRTSANTTETDIAKLEAAGFNVYYDYSNPAIKERVYSLSAMICNGKGERRYFVNPDTCPEYVLCLEQQIWGTNGLPDKKEGLDHKTDAAGYYIHYEFPIVKPATGSTIVRGNY